MINLNLLSDVSKNYSSKSQKIRVLTELWVNENIYCPSCGQKLKKYKNNKPVADFYCSVCMEDYELKSKKGNLGNKIVDGAYFTMIERLNSNTNPSFFFLTYSKDNFDIVNFLAIPKYFFVPDIIEKRKPLSLTAKRAGWVGCNILLNTIPSSGKIYYIKGGKKESKDRVIDKWNHISFLKSTKNLEAKGWLLDIIRCIELNGRNDFTLKDMYKFEDFLKKKHSHNNNIQAKIRQQLQILRDKKYLIFESRGKYKLL